MVEADSPGCGYRWLADLLLERDQRLLCARTCHARPAAEHTYQNRVSPALPLSPIHRNGTDQHVHIPLTDQTL